MQKIRFLAIRIAMLIAVSFVFIIPIGIFILTLSKSIEFFKIAPISEFLLGKTWAPRDDIIAGHFGVIPVLMGTLSMSLVAMTVVSIFGFMCGMYIAEYLSPRKHYVVRIVLDMFAGVPGIVYGFFIAMTCAPYVAKITIFGSPMDPESNLVIGFFIGIYTLPFFVALIDDALRSVPKKLYDSALTLGANRTEIVFGIILPFAKRQIISSFLFATSRCIGETVVILIAGSIMAKYTLNPLIGNTTTTAEIVTLAVADSDFASPRSLATFALSLILFLITFVINTIGNFISEKK